MPQCNGTMDITSSNRCILSNRWRLASNRTVLFNIAVSVIIYFPFFKMYDRKMVLEESGESKEEIEQDMKEGK